MKSELSNTIDTIDDNKMSHSPSASFVHKLWMVKRRSKTILENSKDHLDQERSVKTIEKDYPAPGQYHPDDKLVHKTSKSVIIFKMSHHNSSKKSQVESFLK